MSLAGLFVGDPYRLMDLARDATGMFVCSARMSETDSKARIVVTMIFILISAQRIAFYPLRPV
jgi:hypothetical protein